MTANLRAIMNQNIYEIIIYHRKINLWRVFAKHIAAFDALYRVEIDFVEFFR